MVGGVVLNVMMRSKKKLENRLIPEKEKAMLATLSTEERLYYLVFLPGVVSSVQKEPRIL